MKVIRLYPIKVGNVRVNLSLVERERKQFLRISGKKGEDDLPSLWIPVTKELYSSPFLVVHQGEESLRLEIENIGTTESLYSSYDLEKNRRVLSFLDGKDEISLEEIKKFLGR